MIRINLLRQNVATGGVLTPERPNVGLIAIVLFCVTLLGMGFWWWQLSSEINTKRERSEKLDREAQRLADVQRQVTQFEKQKKMLEGRISIIERLKLNQTGPVNLMESVVNSVPDRPTLWLTNMVQNGSKVKLEGRAFDVPSIADFIANLSRSRSFKSVELVYWQEEEPAIKFELNCGTK
ncbi:MAG TPA: PilN domain-containing protein [Acidobacteriota bacterium]|nr:PilN domain-containing protein [Acidobacteriota bacterium]